MFTFPFLIHTGQEHFFCSLQAARVDIDLDIATAQSPPHLLEESSPGKNNNTPLIFQQSKAPFNGNIFKALADISPELLPHSTGHKQSNNS